VLCHLTGTFQQRRQQFVDRKIGRFDAHRSHSIPRKRCMKTMHSAAAVLVPSTSNESHFFHGPPGVVECCAVMSQYEEFAESAIAGQRSTLDQNDFICIRQKRLRIGSCTVACGKRVTGETTKMDCDARSSNLFVQKNG
jgi:hypothetical protein